MVAEKSTFAAHLVEHVQLFPSLTNPRKRFDEAKLKELADSMAPPVGILEPLVVRPFDPVKMIGRDPVAAANLKHSGPFYEIIAGERRWRAAAIARMTHVPVVVREVSDEQVLRLQLVENKNREDVHPLDEAEAMERLLKLNRTETPKTIAAAIGMSERYVQNRLHYLRLVPEVKEAFRTDEITAGHADLIMRLRPEDQELALSACFVAALDFGENVELQDMRDGTALYEAQPLTDDLPGKVRSHQKPVQRLLSVRELDNWIKGNVRLNVAPGSDETRFFPEIREALTPKPIAGAESVKGTPTLLQVVDSYDYELPKGDKGPAPLTLEHWKLVEGKKKCAYAQRAVVVLGKRRGQILDVCAARACKEHWPHATPAAPVRAPGERRPQKEIDAEKKAEAERKAAREHEQLVMGVWDNVLEKIAPKVVPNKPTAALLKLIAWNGRNNRLSTWREATIEELENVGGYALHRKDVFAKVAALIKPLGIDLPRLVKEAELKAKGITAPLTPAPAKKPKPARTSLSKTASSGTRKALAPRKRKAGKKR
jgi:ParB/RepB/Spo0J family partition protein